MCYRTKVRGSSERKRLTFLVSPPPPLPLGARSFSRWIILETKDKKFSFDYLSLRSRYLVVPNALARIEVCEIKIIAFLEARFPRSEACVVVGRRGIEAAADAYPIHRIPRFNGPYPEYAMTRGFYRLGRRRRFRGIFALWATIHRRGGKGEISKRGNGGGRNPSIRGFITIVPRCNLQRG